MEMTEFIDAELDFLPIFIRVTRWINQNAVLELEEECILPPTQMQALVMLKAYTTLTMTQLADCLMMPRQQLTKIIDALVEKQLVERKADPANRRHVLTELSPHGRKFLDDKIYSAHGAMARFSNFLNEEQRAKMTEAFRLFREVLSDMDLSQPIF